MGMLEGLLIECGVCSELVFVVMGERAYSSCPGCHCVYVIKQRGPHRLTPRELVALVRANPRMEVRMGMITEVLTRDPRKWH